MSKRRVLTAAQIGRKGGRAYARNHTQQQRSDRARRAALAMWEKKRKAVA